MTSRKAQTPGRARVVLASANDDAAAVTTILVETRTSSPADRILFAGDVAVAEATVRHVQDDILPIMDTLCVGLGIPPQLFTIHVLGLAAAAAKEVPLYFLGEIEKTRAFHAQDWPSVRDSIFEDRRDFNYYFDFVLNEAKKLEPLWIK